MKPPQISVIIITYKRELELKKVIKNILSQDKKEIEIIVVDNDPHTKLKKSKLKGVKYYHPKNNLGVAGGRNFGATKANGDILVFIDDDAFFEKRDNFDKIVKIFKNPKIGCVAFKVKNFYKKNILKHEFPHKDLTKINEEFLVGYFIGCGHAIKRKLFLQTSYDKNLLKYGFEELDLSYKLINKNYYIKYSPEITIIHKPSKRGRLPSKENFYSYVKNKAYVTTKYLPLKYLLVNLSLWFLYLAKISICKRRFLIFISGFSSGLKEGLINREKENILNTNAVTYLKKVKGRLYY